ncbi:TRAP transporter substrate-binding protein [Halomonas sp. MCCC 1A17488]|uniref:TRAP transporter substrate-binding protein n=1 Tax=unclassified Halomonas TaxID=2609666 RepID=UPI0018D245C4|nr:MULTISPECIES: TRAP transporter substrate-binding protein [unclassified Halomonas]MCE8016234.1 TRAP transporter substrate-binding protein [Halomonas sp. MCCC 1A17488]MCG3239567.1 TRAP transporter substrate-binding protein [Halomonas sp. MCCC 1A17488]QPP50516.1 TRAP transporter substrate-binding protein [Halomonas sp. SS10-MC5]
MKSNLNKVSLAVAIAAASFGMTQAQAAEYTFSFAHVLIEDTPNGQAALRFKEEVEEKSDGRIQIDVLPAAQVGGDVEIIEQIQMGLVDIGIPPTATLGNFEPRLQILDLPFLIADYDTMVKVLDGEVGREILDTLNDDNMFAVNFWGAGFRHMTNNVRPIHGPEDLEAIRMRTMQAPIIISTYENLDANATAMAFTEVYNGLQQGVVEGQENPLANIYTMRFHEVQDYLSLTNHAYHAYAAVINQDSWDSLPEDLQEVMLEAFDNGRDTSRQLTLEDEGRILEEIEDEIAINEITPEAREAFIEASLPVHEEYEEIVTTDLLHKVYDEVGIEY